MIPERRWQRASVAQEPRIVGVRDLAGCEQEPVHPDSINGPLILLARIAAHPEGASWNRDKCGKHRYVSGLSGRFCRIHEFASEGKTGATSGAYTTLRRGTIPALVRTAHLSLWYIQ